jgi:hypothetical protein
MEDAGMDASPCAVAEIRIPVKCAPKKAPCPTCGKLGVRKRKPLHRSVRSIAYRAVVFLDITYGEYRATCPCCKTFRNNPDGVLPKGHYDNKVREAVLNRILGDAMSVEAVLRAMRRDFLLDLSTGFVYDCLEQQVRRLNLGSHRQRVLEWFSGTLCVDELHLGRYTLLLATDPLRDLPVAFALVAANDQGHMRRFLQNLANWGLRPRVVVTDGSNLYPTVLAEVWPDAAHQLCIFHVLKDINGKILDEVRRLRGELARRGKAGRRRRGRRGQAHKARQRRRGPTAKEKAHFVFKHRHLIVLRRERLTARQGKDLTQMLEYLPDLWPLRQFADDIYGLFRGRQSPHRAWCLRARLLRVPAYQALPGLVEAMAMLERDKFAKMIAFLTSPARQRVRTNNHVERANRKLRYFEKVRYKWRRRRTLVRFLALALDRWWQEVWARDSDVQAQPAPDPKCASASPSKKRGPRRPQTS